MKRIGAQFRSGIASVAMATIAAAATPHHAIAQQIITSASGWSAVTDGQTFGDVFISGARRVAFLLPPKSKHFVLRLSNGAWRIPEGTTVPISVQFADGQRLHLDGIGQQQSMQFSLADSLVASWTHNFTASATMTVVFLQGAEAPWEIPLTGTTPTIEAMAKSITDAGISGLPKPWSAEGYGNAAPDFSGFGTPILPPDPTLSLSEQKNEVEAARRLSAQKLVENSPDNHCKEPAAARMLLSEFNEMSAAKALGDTAIDIEHLTTKSFNLDETTMACHGTFMLSKGGRLTGVIEFKKNVAGDPIVTWAMDH